MSWHNHERFFTEADPLRFHCRGLHFKSFSCSNNMGKERVSTIQRMCNSIFLMLLQFYLRIHPWKGEPRSIKLTRYDVVEVPVVVAHQSHFSFFIPIHPFEELVPQVIHLLRHKQRCLLKHHPFIITNPNLPVIERSLEYGQRVCIFRSKGRIHLDLIRAISVPAVMLHLPLSRGGSILNKAICPAIFQYVSNKLFNILRRNPRCA